MSPGFLSDGPLVLSRAPFTPVASCDGDIPCSPVLVPPLLDVPVVEEFGFARRAVLIAGITLDAGTRTLVAKVACCRGILPAAIAGTAAKRAANAVAAIIFFMAFPSLVFFLGGECNADAAFAFPGARLPGEKTHYVAITSAKKVVLRRRGIQCGQRWLPNIPLFEPMLPERIELRGVRMERPDNGPALLGRRMPIPGP